MISMSRMLSKSLIAGTLGLTLSAGAVMAEYPDRPITVVVSYGAGGATDFQARIVTMMSGMEDKDGKPVYLNGQPMVIVNRPGPVARSAGTSTLSRRSRMAMSWPHTTCRTLSPSRSCFPRK